MIRVNGSKPGTIRTVSLILSLGFAVTGCADLGESNPSPKPDSGSGVSAEASPTPGKKAQKVRPGSQTPGDADYGDKPATRGRGR
jgi:hypothetical protein